MGQIEFKGLEFRALTGGNGAAFPTAADLYQSFRLTGDPEDLAGAQTEYGRFCTSMQFYSPDLLLGERQG